MARVNSLVKLRAPIGGQEIELQQIDFDAGDAPSYVDPRSRSTASAPRGGEQLSSERPGDSCSAAAPVSPDAAGAGTPIKMLRTRIREGSRFTVFDIDPLTAEQWGGALLAWARAQPRG